MAIEPRDQTPPDPNRILFDERPGEDSHPLSSPDPIVGGTDPADRPDLFAKEEEKKKEPEPAPPAQPQIQPGHTVQDLTQALVMAEQERARQAAQRQEWEQTQERLRKELTPPQLPTTEEEMEKLTLEGPLLRKKFEEVIDWTNKALKFQAETLHQQFARDLAQAQAPLWEDRRERALRSAAEALSQSGFSDSESIVMDLENRLRANPQNYWDLVTDPQALVRGGRMIAEEAGIQPQRPIGNLAPRGPSGMRYTPGQPSSAGGGEVPNDVHLARAEKLLGVKIRPEYRQRYGNAVEDLRGLR